jgi:Ca-activated chloride channel family protein
VEQAISLLAARVRHPVLTDLALETGAIDVHEVYPRNLPDLFAGEELVVFGRYRETGQASITIRGRRSGAPERYATRAVFGARASGDDYIPRLWASRKLGDLDRRIRSAQADGATGRQVESLIAELRETALRYGLLSEYTSYLVQEPGMLAMRDAPMALAAAPPPVSGQAAVARAEDARRSREVASVAQMNAAQAFAAERVAPDAAVADGELKATRGSSRLIGGRTFTLRTGEWIDARHTDRHRKVEIAAYSDAYFAVIRALPEAGLVLRELDRVTIAGREISLRIGESGSKSLSEVELRRLVADFR